MQEEMEAKVEAKMEAKLEAELNIRFQKWMDAAASWSNLQSDTGSSAAPAPMGPPPPGKKVIN